jgi:hypothetical protein
LNAQSQMIGNANNIKNIVSKKTKGPKQGNRAKGPKQGNRAKGPKQGNRAKGPQQGNRKSDKVSYDRGGSLSTNNVYNT